MKCLLLCALLPFAGCKVTDDSPTSTDNQAQSRPAHPAHLANAPIHTDAAMPTSPNPRMSILTGDRAQVRAAVQRRLDELAQKVSDFVDDTQRPGRRTHANVRRQAKALGQRLEATRKDVLALLRVGETNWDQAKDAIDEKLKALEAMLEDEPAPATN